MVRVRSAASLILLLGGLISPPIFAAQPLSAWLHEDLLPYLSARLVEHPRLKGQPFEVVATKEGRIAVEINGLTAYIRQQIVDALQAVPGANLVQPLPSAQPWDYRTIGDVSCPVAGRAKVQVTVETERSSVTGDVRVAVQAVDLAERKWVRGFKKVWTGTPTETEREQLAARRIDDSLLGSRDLPYGADQPDLLAAYLAAGVACRLLERGEGRARLFVRPRRQGETADYFAKVAALTAEYLSTLQEIELTGDRARADTLLDLQAHQIDGELHQVWAQIGAPAAESALVRPSVPAYVSLRGAEPAFLSRSAGEAAPLIGQFELIAPVSQGSCGRPNAWAEGRRNLASGAHLPSGGCFAIRYRAAADSKLYLLAQNSQGELTQLLPDSCDALHLGLESGRIGSGEAVHIPLFRDRSPGYFVLDNQPGEEWVFAVAVTDADTETQLGALVARAGSLCRTEGPSRSRRVAALQALLEALAVQQGRDRLDWRAGYFIHDPG